MVHGIQIDFVNTRKKKRQKKARTRTMLIFDINQIQPGLTCRT